jgi:hypothetical protein
MNDAGLVLVDGALDVFAAKAVDHALDLPPMAEAQNIAAAAALFGTRRRFEGSMLTEASDQFGGVGKRVAPGNEGSIHLRVIARSGYANASQSSSTGR